MTARIVTDGQDPLTKPSLDLLKSWGVPPEMIKRIVLDSRHGDVQILQVTLMVPSEAHLQPPMCNEHGQPMVRGLDEWLCVCTRIPLADTAILPRATLNPGGYIP